ncbi:hypothetical protein [Alicyclobacillus shizuokensis]|uniref:hypothetical protein n=1 Tax=Alicyclobacillus shizuokensis TaxID=392014 RepID=UPI000A9BA351|nr:hypothetical protein [Alicyclobacillus shizuokensis]MCL6625074.1 hypothetical protein [Alicyclobacillus shizuokensis]
MKTVVVPPVAKAFIALAGVHFLVGSVLGAVMAAHAEAADVLAVHAEINPFGWLTMMMYGMTYAVLRVSAGLQPPWRVLGWIHLVVAEAGVLAILFGSLGHQNALSVFGDVLQAAAPVVFLLNILSAVMAARRGPANRPGADVLPTTVQFLGRSPRWRQSDGVAQRGTDLALMALIAATVWIAAQSLRHGHRVWLEWPIPAHLLVQGWVGGTLMAVSLHLFPRLTARAAPVAVAKTVQVLWGLSLLAAVAGVVWGTQALRAASAFFGAAVAIQSLLQVGGLWRAADAGNRLTGAARWAWWGAALYALALGLWLLFGQDVDSAAAMHLLFLGWATTLVYAVGYTLFPLLLGICQANRGWAYAQVMASLVGTLLLVFSLSPNVASALSSPAASTLLSALGGILAASGAYAFILYLLLSLVSARANSRQ